PLVKYDNDEGISKPSICHMFNYSSHVTFQEMGAVLGTWFVIYFMAIQTCFFDNFELKVYIIVYSRIILTEFFKLVPFVNEIFESTKGTYGAATELDILQDSGCLQRICCFEAHMKLGNGTQMKFSPFEGFAPHPIELGTDGHNPEEIKNVLGWMEQALIIQDCDYRPIFLLLKITGVSLGSMQITFELAVYHITFNSVATNPTVDQYGLYHFNRGREQPTYTYPNNLIISLLLTNNNRDYIFISLDSEVYQKGMHKFMWATR
ncbi:hypothetical protein ACJX0J_023057, partial [Zea mays]